MTLGSKIFSEVRFVQLQLRAAKYYISLCLLVAGFIRNFPSGLSGARYGKAEEAR